jgi:hypothetical protein
MLFNILFDMLAIIIECIKNDDQIEGLVPHRVDKGLCIHQYPGARIIFMDHGLENPKKLILAGFDKLLGLKFNFHQKKLFYFEEVQYTAFQYAKLFGCEHGQFPIWYLGILSHC